MRRNGRWLGGWLDPIGLWLRLHARVPALEKVRDAWLGASNLFWIQDK